MFKKSGVPKEYKGFLSNKKVLIATTTLVGTVVGAGMLGIPYVIAKAGFLYGLLLIISIGVAFVFLHLFAGEVVLRTTKQHQLTGYAGKYLGPLGKKVMVVAMIISIYGALTAYLIGEGATFYSLFGVGSPLLYSVLFFIVTSLILFHGIKATGRSELILISALLLVIALIGIFSFSSIETSNFSPFNPAFFFLPLGVIIFSFTGLPCVPELQEVLHDQREKMKPAIIAGAIIPIILYVIFTIVVVGVVGLDNFSLLAPDERIATIALGIYSHPILGVLANILAILAMFTSYLTLGLAGIEMYEYDYGFSRNAALALTFIFPLVIVLLGLTSFIEVLGITGVFAGGLEAIAIILMFWRAKKKGDRKPEYSLKKHTLLGSILISLFVFGMGFQLWQIIF